MLILLTLILSATMALFLVAAVRALHRRRPLRMTAHVLSAVLLLMAAATAGALAFAIRGYQAFTHEETAAVIELQPRGPRRFVATVTFPDGSRRAYQISGDALYVDAHILKWKPFANLLGLHTLYALDRIGGRYADIEAERTRPRTLFRLAPEQPLDVFGLVRRHPFLSPLIDARYGSATFKPVSAPQRFELRVSTTGLLIRELPVHEG